MVSVSSTSASCLPDTVKRPQMQWNMIDRTVVDHPMFEGLADDAWVYFVHSYAAEPGPDVVATCAYGDDLVAAVGRDHVWACQFHPENRAERSPDPRELRRCGSRA